MVLCLSFLDFLVLFVVGPLTRSKVDMPMARYPHLSVFRSVCLAHPVSFFAAAR